MKDGEFKKSRRSQLLAQREALNETARRQFDESTSMTAVERLAETMALCEFTAALACASGQPVATFQEKAEQYSDRWARREEAWKSKRPA